MRTQLKINSSNISLLIFFLSINFIQGAINYSNINTTLNNDINKEFVISEDAFLTVPELIRKYGYPVEIHEEVVTDDGYVLTLHRIPYGKKSGPSPNKPIVYIQPGFISNSVDAILTGPDNALGYYLADKGFDVWIGNTRGTRYCNKHTSTSRRSRKYWDYSFSDIGIQDIPTMIDYILKVTKQENLFYIGHSRGTTTFFIMCSEKPEYNKKIRAMAAMAPVSYMNHIPNPLFHIAAHNNHLLLSLLHALNIFYVSIDHSRLIEICKYSDSLTFVQPNICTLLLFTLGGFDLQNFNVTLLPAFFGHLPDSFSIKEFSHYGQAVLSGKFRNFNYGPTMNMIKYNQINPPDYDLSKVTAPVAIFYSTNDLQSSAVDAERLSEELGNLVGKYLIQEGPNHFSYFNGMYARSQIYDKILDVFSNY